jgi:hypothetical protein
MSGVVLFRTFNSNSIVTSWRVFMRNNLFPNFSLYLRDATFFFFVIGLALSLSLPRQDAHPLLSVATIMLSRKDIEETLRQFANYAPLLAALLAPLSTLYDIPSLSQKWYSYDGAELADPKASLVLSGISLAVSVTANTLLVLRFSVSLTKVGPSCNR